MTKTQKIKRKKLHDDVETVIESSCLGDRMNLGGGCEAVVTSRSRKRMGNNQRMPRFTLQRKISSENQRNCI